MRSSFFEWSGQNLTNPATRQLARHDAAFSTWRLRREVRLLGLWTAVDLARGSGGGAGLCLFRQSLPSFWQSW